MMQESSGSNSSTSSHSAVTDIGSDLEGSHHHHHHRRRRIRHEKNHLRTSSKRNRNLEEHCRKEMARPRRRYYFVWAFFGQITLCLLLLGVWVQLCSSPNTQQEPNTPSTVANKNAESNTNPPLLARLFRRPRHRRRHHYNKHHNPKFDQSKRNKLRIQRQQQQIAMLLQQQERKRHREATDGISFIPWVPPTGSNEFGRYPRAAASRNNNKVPPAPRILKTPDNPSTIPNGNRTTIATEKINHKKNRTLVILLGDLRCGEAAWQSLLTHVLDVNQDADLMLLVQDHDHNSDDNDTRNNNDNGENGPNDVKYPIRNTTLFRRAMHVELMPNFTADWAWPMDAWMVTPTNRTATWGHQNHHHQNNNNNNNTSEPKTQKSYENPVASAPWRRDIDRLFPAATHPTVWGGLAGGYRASAAILGVYKWVAGQRLLAHDWHTQYQNFVVARTDQYYPCPLKVDAIVNPPPPTVLQNKNGDDDDNNMINLNDDFFGAASSLWVPSGEDYGGICDRFMIATSETILDSLDVLRPVLHNLENWIGLLPTNTNPEYFLLQVWMHHFGLFPQRFPRSMYTCMAPGDASRWGHLEGYVPAHNVHLKYQTEFEPARHTCRLNPKEVYRVAEEDLGG